MTSTPLPPAHWDLGGDWRLRVDPDGRSPLPEAARELIGRELPATVPGAVPADLLRAGVIDDPVFDANERAAAWVSRTDWILTRTLPEVPAGRFDRIDLAFDGIDTVADITIDGDRIGRTRNMHRRYRFDVTDRLGGHRTGADPAADRSAADGAAANRAGGGTHELAVHFTSPYTEAESLRAAVGPRPNAYPEPFNFIRKMACSFGWDWGLTLPGCGLWRPVRLEAWNTARLADVAAFAEMTASRGALRLRIDTERSAAGRENVLGLDVLIDGKRIARSTLAPGQCSAEITVDGLEVTPWNPVGHGVQARYALTVRLIGPHGDRLGGVTQRIGFRTVSTDRGPDAAGTRFTMRLNDEPILIKGINWIPDDILPGRMTRRRYAHRLAQARDAGCNLIRVWGGGVYESDDFYELCDEMGLLVWQDFPFACAAYPEDEPLRSEILAEAEDNVTRLASHPSLVVWNGSNENPWLRLAENWTDQPGGDRPWGERYYLADLPDVIARLDPTRPYTPSSPWSGSSDLFPNAVAHQTFHSWDVWNREDYTHYRDSAPRFVSEFGWQAPPAWRTLRDAVSDQPMTPSSRGVVRHQKAAGGMDKLASGLAPHAPVPADFDAWHYLMQWNQVQAITTGVLHWRSSWPHTAGMILWQLNDLWPVLSWSAIDGAGRPKPLYFALRELYADRAVTIAPGGEDGLVVSVLNDTDDEWSANLTLRRVADAGADLARRRVPVRVAPRGVSRLEIPGEISRFGEAGTEVILAEIDGMRAWHYGTEATDSGFVGAPPHITAREVDDGFAVDVTATTLLRDLLIQPDRIHPTARCDRGFVTLLAGESTTITVTCPPDVPAAALDGDGVVTWLDRVLAR